jgi:hypothetical protein
MLRVPSLPGLALLVSCCVKPNYAASSDIGLIRNLQNKWARCLNQSYHVTRKQTPDKGAAAEMSFQACGSEEQDLTSYITARIPSALSPMPHLKAEIKHLLINEGRLPVYPDH